MGLFRDRFAEAKADEHYERKVNRMRSVDGRKSAPGGRTRSISAELRGRPGDRERIAEAKRRERRIKHGEE